MSDTERLARMERRQEALIGAIDGLVDVMTVNNAMLAELMAWMKEPPSTDLQDVLKAVLAAVEEMRAELHGLPEKVARAVLDGDLDSRG